MRALGRCSGKILGACSDSVIEDFRLPLCGIGIAKTWGLILVPERSKAGADAVARAEQGNEDLAGRR